MSTRINLDQLPGEQAILGITPSGEVTFTLTTICLVDWNDGSPRVMTENGDHIYTNFTHKNVKLTPFTGLQSITNFTIDGTTTLDAHELTGLVNLTCQGNNLTLLNVAGLTNLSALFLVNNHLVTADLSTLLVLNDAELDGNHLTSLLLPVTSTLQTLLARNNQLTSIALSGRTGLVNLQLGNNNLTSINLAGLSALVNLGLNNNNLTSINLSGLSSLENVALSNNNLSAIDFAGLTSVASMDLTSNPSLATLSNLSAATSLISLYVADVAIANLNITAAAALVNFICGENSALLTLDAHGLSALSNADFSGSPLLTDVDLHGCISLSGISLTGCSSLATLNVTNTGIGSLNFQNSPIVTVMASSCPSMVAFTIGGTASLLSVDCHGNSALSSFNISDGAAVTVLHSVNLNGCALDSATINNSILQTLAGGSVSNGTLDISGGTNAAPSGQGITDVATLQGRGWTVTTN